MTADACACIYCNAKMWREWCLVRQATPVLSDYQLYDSEVFSPIEIPELYITRPRHELGKLEQDHCQVKMEFGRSVLKNVRGYVLEIVEGNPDDVQPWELSRWAKKIRHFRWSLLR
jgi:hypothetical protein